MERIPPKDIVHQGTCKSWLLSLDSFLFSSPSFLFLLSLVSAVLAKHLACTVVVVVVEVEVVVVGFGSRQGPRTIPFQHFNTSPDSAQPSFAVHNYTGT